MLLLFKRIFSFFKQWSLEILKLTLAFLMIFYLLYIRLWPPVARDLWENMNHYQLGSTLLSLVFLIINMYFLLVILEYISPPNNNPHPIIRRLRTLGENFGEYLRRLLINFYEFVWYLVEFIVEKLFNYDCLQYETLRRVAKKFNKESNFKYICWLLLGLLLIPKIIFVWAFACDVLVFKHLDWTFKCLPILLIPQIENFLIFTLENYYDTHRQSINAFVQKESIPNTGQADYSFIPEFKETPPDFVKNFEDFFYNHFWVLHQARKNIIKYTEWKYKESPYFRISLILCVIRLLILVYVLLYGVL